MAALLVNVGCSSSDAAKSRAATSPDGAVTKHPQLLPDGGPPLKVGGNPMVDPGRPVDVGSPGVWVDVTPKVAKPWVGSGYFGFDGIDGGKPDAPGTVYASLDHGGDADSGVWKTTDGGKTWAHLDTGPGGVLAKTGAQPLVVDPTDSKVVYAGSIKTGLGLYKSTDGGATWGSGSILPQGIEGDVYWMSIDPNNHEHLILTFHSPGGNWASTGNAGVLESVDGGATWPNAVPAGGWTGAGQFAFFVGKKNDNTVDADGTIWIVATQNNGIFRTEDRGKNWEKVGTVNMTHGMESLYRAPDEALYLGSVQKIYRSLDNGKSWEDSGAQSSPDGYGGFVGDGTNIWAMLANTGSGTAGPYQWQALPIGDTTSSPADSHWAKPDGATYADGPSRMIYDAVSGIVYASCWGNGLWRYKTP